MNYFLMVFLIGLLILVHELGHFLAARWMNIAVARFSIGFGPKLWGYKKGNTEYWLSLIPIGGYVLPEIEEETEFFRIPVYKRVVFTLGGPAANIILVIFLLGIMNVTVSGFSGSGVFIQPLSQTVALLKDFLAVIPQLFSHSDQLSGVVGIVVSGGQYVGADLLKALSFSIFLSLNLAVLNLLPIPPLDGGKILLYLLEKVHPALLRLHIPLAAAGWLFLIGLMVYATVLDIGRYVAAITIKTIGG